MNLQTLANKNQKNEKILNSEDIFTGAREVLIRHKDEIYRLMITKTGKLILNK